MRRWAGPLLSCLLGLALFLGGQSHLLSHTANSKRFDPDVEVVLPVPGSLALAMGDAHLAANLGVIRALVAANHMEAKPERAMFARLIGNSMDMAPAQEDGYYLAQATLPWWGYFALNQRIQGNAAEARPWEWLPSFFQAFNLFYFKKSPEEGAAFLREAAKRASPRNRQSLLAMAGRWIALDDRPKEALKIIKGMAQSNKKGPLRRNLALRAEQLKGLLALRKASNAYRKAKGRAPERLEQLVGFGGLDRIPKDPMQDGYIVNNQGQVVIRPPKALTQELNLP